MRAFDGEHIDLTSRAGEADALGTIVSIPIWYGLIGLFIAATWWCWSLAVNEIAMVKAASRDAVAQSAHAEQARARVLDAGLGRHGLLYAESVSYVEKDRAIARQIDISNTIARFGYDIKLRVITRIEAFYARPPLEDWE